MIRILKWAFGMLLVAVIGLGFAYWTPDTDKAAMRAKYGGPTSQYVDLGGGLTVHVRDEGPRDAPVIVLLHGANASLHTWDAWAARLGKTHRIVRFDQIGHGLTGPAPDRNYSMAAFVDTVERVTTKLGIAKFALGGGSMGGGVAWNYAVAHPERLSALILVDAAGAPYPSEPPPPLVFRIVQTPAFTPVLLRITPRALVAAAARSAVVDPATYSEASIDRTWELLRYPGNRAATVDWQKVARVAATPAQMATIAVPTLILWGERDPQLPLWGARWFAQNIRGSELIVYPGVGHLPNEEVPQKSADDMAGWLAKTRDAKQ